MPRTISISKHYQLKFEWKLVPHYIELVLRLELIGHLSSSTESLLHIFKQTESKSKVFQNMLVKQSAFNSICFYSCSVIVHQAVPSFTSLLLLINSSGQNTQEQNSMKRKKSDGDAMQR